MASSSRRSPAGCLLLRSPSWTAGTKTLFQRRHQIDDFCIVVGGLHRFDAPAFALFFNQCPYRVLVSIAKFLGVEVARLLFDDLLGNLQHLRIGLRQIGVVDVMQASER